MLPSGTEPGSGTGIRPWRHWLPRVLLESLLIMFSVLFALAVDQWRVRRARLDRAAVALQSIQSELRENRASIQRARNNHIAMRDSLRSYIARRQMLPERVYYRASMFSPGLTHATAWESARETGVTGDIPYELLLQLSRVYDWQVRYQALGDALAHDLMLQIRREGLETVMRDRPASFVILQEDFANRESRLLQRYDSVLTMLRDRQW